MMRINQRGVSYISILIATAIAPIVILSATMGIVHGKRLSDGAKARTVLLSAAQDEIERMRGISFDLVQTYTVDRGNISGSVNVEFLTVRRKRVAVVMTHDQFANQSVTLVTYVHRDGLNAS